MNAKGCHGSRLTAKGQLFRNVSAVGALPQRIDAFRQRKETRPCRRAVRRFSLFHVKRRFMHGSSPALQGTQNPVDKLAQSRPVNTLRRTHRRGKNRIGGHTFKKQHAIGGHEQKPPQRELPPEKRRPRFPRQEYPTPARPYEEAARAARSASGRADSTLSSASCADEGAAAPSSRCKACHAQTSADGGALRNLPEMAAVLRFREETLVSAIRILPASYWQIRTF